MCFDCGEGICGRKVVEVDLQCDHLVCKTVCFMYCVFESLQPVMSGRDTTKAPFTAEMRLVHWPDCNPLMALKYHLEDNGSLSIKCDSFDDNVTKHMEKHGSSTDEVLNLMGIYLSESVGKKSTDPHYQVLVKFGNSAEIPVWALQHVPKAFVKRMIMTNTTVKGLVIDLFLMAALNKSYPNFSNTFMWFRHGSSVHGMKVPIGCTMNNVSGNRYMYSWHDYTLSSVESTKPASARSFA